MVILKRISFFILSFVYRNENKVLETFEKLLNHSKVNVSKNIIDTLFIAIDQETYSDSTRVTMKEKLANYFAKQNLNELDTYLSQKVSS